MIGRISRTTIARGLWRAHRAGWYELTWFYKPPAKKQLLVISETDGYLVDGVIAGTGCTVGHRILRVEDYGKVAATFVDVKTSRAVRLAPRLDIRELACSYVQDEPRHYFAQMQAYQGHARPGDVKRTGSGIECSR